MTTELHGVDVSSHQTGWSPASDDVFVFVKATEGTSYVNPAHDDQVAVARAAGLVVGHYHWLVAGKTSAQLDYFIEHANIEPGDLIALDWEDSSNPSSDEKDQWIRDAQQRLSGHRVGLYCNRDWWINHDVSSFAGDFLWIAEYGVDAPNIKADWIFWQYTSTPIDQNVTASFDDVDALRAWAGVSDDGGEPGPDPDADGAWFSTDYLYPKVTPNPANPHKIKSGDRVEVTASGGLKARTLPGGPQAIKDGEPLVRDQGYEFDVTADLVDGWVTGGSNWYSSDYLDVCAEPPPKPSWSSKPYVILDDPTPDPDRNVSYMQAVVRVAALDTDDGEHYDACYIVAQDYQNSGDLRFGLLYADGRYTEQWMQVNDGGHGQTFHAYRSAAGNLYVWCGENPAYRYKWQNGKKVAKSSGDKMDYKGCRPVGSYEPYVGFRDATDTRETFYLFDRTDFTGNVNRTNPIKSVTVDKRTNYTQQSWAVSDTRIYRIMGSTNDDPPHGSKLHIIDVFDWSGKLLLDRFDVTAMSIETSSDEPEGLTFSGTPGSLLAGKREGSSDPSKRSYPIWTLSGLP